MSSRSTSSTPRRHLALDLGATSGRAMLGRWDGAGRLELEELNRFPHVPRSDAGGMTWDWETLYAGCRTGLTLALRAGALDGVSCDSWAVDHGLLDAEGALVAPPFSYQDPQRTQRGGEELTARMQPAELFAQAGSPYIAIATLHQLLATRALRPELLARARQMLLIPDLIHHALSGEAASEFCAASTTALTHHATRAWNTELAEELGLPAQLLPRLAPSATRLGSLRAGLAEGAGDVPIYLTAGHDTAAAVTGAPREAEGDLVISSGTWMMLALPGPRPIVTPEVFAAGFGNYGLPGDEWMFINGIMGLYLLERLRREEELDPLPELCAQAAQAPALSCLFDPADPRLTGEGRLITALRGVAAGWGERFPEDTATQVRAILESLAAYAARSIARMEALAGRPVRRLVVVGGGVRNRLLNRLLADFTARPVLEGNPEATAVGNLLLQLRAAGELGSMDELREVVRTHFRGEAWEPQAAAHAAIRERLDGIEALRGESAGATA